MKSFIKGHRRSTSMDAIDSLSDPTTPKLFQGKFSNFIKGKKSPFTSPTVTTQEFAASEQNSPFIVGTRTHNWGESPDTDQSIILLSGKEIQRLSVSSVSSAASEAHDTKMVKAANRKARLTSHEDLANLSADRSYVTMLDSTLTEEALSDNTNDAQDTSEDDSSSQFSFEKGFGRNSSVKYYSKPEPMYVDIDEDLREEFAEDFDGEYDEYDEFGGYDDSEQLFERDYFGDEDVSPVKRRSSLRRNMSGSVSSSNLGPACGHNVPPESCKMREPPRTPEPVRGVGINVPVTSSPNQAVSTTPRTQDRQMHGSSRAKLSSPRRVLPSRSLKYHDLREDYDSEMPNKYASFLDVDSDPDCDYDIDEINNIPDDYEFNSPHSTPASGARRMHSFERLSFTTPESQRTKFENKNKTVTLYYDEDPGQLTPPQRVVSGLDQLSPIQEGDYSHG